MYFPAIYVVIFACLTVLLIKEFKPWGTGESQSPHWLWWTLYQPSSMTKGAAFSLASCLWCQPLGKSTIIGLPARLHSLVGEGGGMQLGPYPSALTYSPKKFSHNSACQIVRTWEEIIFHCHERFVSRRGSWTENQTCLERPFLILLSPSSEVFNLGHREETAEVLHQQETSCCVQWMLNQLLFVGSSQRGLPSIKKMRDAVVSSPQVSWMTLHGFCNHNDYFIIIIILIIL